MRCVRSMMSTIAVSLLCLTACGKAEKILEEPSWQRDYNAGLRAQQEHNIARAIKKYEAALHKKPDYPEALSNLGHCYLLTTKHYLALTGEKLSKALELSATPATVFQEGNFFLMNGQLVSAYKNYAELLHSDPEQGEKLREIMDPVLIDAHQVLSEYSPQE